MPYKDSVKKKEYNTEYLTERRANLKQHAYDSITSGVIIDRRKWDMWCTLIKSKSIKRPFTKDFTNDIIFEMMIEGCFYCGNIATSVDRIDSTLDHTPSNCVATCWGCNCSKGASDSATFIRKSYFRARRKYADTNINIWFVNKQKPRLYLYKRRAEKQGVPFEITEDAWSTMIRNDCKYCHRKPTTWFGIDRIIPSKGYVSDNVVTCCFDCNVDKHEDDVEMMMNRNEQIAKRLDAGKLVIDAHLDIILHIGTQKTGKNVCVYGKVYENQSDASRALEKGDAYVSRCIGDGRYSDDIFEISIDFYDFAIETKLKNITKKMYILFKRM